MFYRADPRIPLTLDQAAKGLTNCLASCRAEMTMALKIMGHHPMADLGIVTCALDPKIAQLAHVPYAGDPAG